MSKKGKEPVPVTHTLKGCFDTTGGVSNYEDKTQMIVEHFKAKTVEILAKSGIALDWSAKADASCALQIKLVEIDTGNTTVRFIVGWLPIIGNFCGPAATFQAEGQYTRDGKSTALTCHQTNCNARFGTEWSMRVASGNAAIRLAEELKPLMTAS